jgi:hypothetical protein
MLIAIDFDGTLVARGEPPRWLPGAKEALRALLDAGHEVIIHTARVSQPMRLQSAKEFFEKEGFGGLKFWDKPGKPQAAWYVDDRALPVNSMAGIPSLSWEAVVKICQTAPLSRDWVKNADPPRLKVLAEDNWVKVWLVDGWYVRDLLDIDFTQGGHHWRYKFIPENEIWIDDALRVEERRFVIMHEALERWVMQKGAEYEVAHELASQVEKIARRKRGEEREAYLGSIYGLVGLCLDEEACRRVVKGFRFREDMRG